MSPTAAWATALRVFAQLRRDPRTIALLMIVPVALITLLKYMFIDSPGVFERIGVPLLGLFPFIAMFLITSITMLRERTTGTLERLMAMPIAKLDLLLGYGIAFATVAAIQATLVSLVAFGLLDLHTSGPRWLVVFLAVTNAVLGMALGLLLSAFARTEFQAVQFMPAFVFPQILLCGLIVPRDQMARALEIVSYVLPLTYAYDALRRVSDDLLDARLALDVTIVLAATLARPRARGRDPAQANALGEQVSNLARDHELFPRRDDLDGELAEVLEAAGDRVPDIRSVLADAAGEREDVEAAEGHGHLRHGAGDPVRVDREAERVVEPAERREPGLVLERGVELVDASGRARGAR